VPKYYVIGTFPLLFYIRWFLCQHGMVRPQFADRGYVLHVWKGDANVLYKQLRTAQKRWSGSLAAATLYEIYSSELSTNFTLLFIPCILLLSYCLKVSKNMYHTFNDSKSYYKISLNSDIFRWQPPPSSGKAQLVRRCFSLQGELSLMMVVVAAIETCCNIEWFCNNFWNH
jgi:hypothetical protein